VIYIYIYKTCETKHNNKIIKKEVKKKKYII